MPPGLNDSLTRQVAENAVGGAVRLQDLPGVGEKTIRDLRSNGFRNIQDVKNATVQDLMRVPGIGEKTATDMIRSAGGDPRGNARSSTGSVSAAGIMMPVGDFKVEAGDQDRAEARDTRHERSDHARRMDQHNRAPVTTDVDEWRNNKDRLDFPGVDTPTDQPDLKRKDRPFVDYEDDLTSDGQDEWEGLFF